MEISASNKTAIIIGTSGLVGGFLLDALITHKAYSSIVSLGRRKVKMSSPKLIEHKIDFNDKATYEHLVKGDDLFICLGTTIKKAGSREAFEKVDFQYVKNIAEAASLNEVGQVFMVSSVGADKDSIFFYNQVKGKIESEIKNMEFWSTHIFQPSILLGERPENRFGENIAKVIGKGLDKVLGGLLHKYKPVEAETVANAMVNAAQKLSPGLHLYPSDVLQDLAEEEDRKRVVRK